MLIDLSHTIATGMMQVGSLPPVEVCRASSLAEGNPTNGQAIRISGHSGTHIDAPLHVFDELASIETFLPRRASGLEIAARRLGRKKPYKGWPRSICPMSGGAGGLHPLSTSQNHG